MNTVWPSLVLEYIPVGDSVSGSKFSKHSRRPSSKWLLYVQLIHACRSCGSYCFIQVPLGQKYHRHDDLQLPLRTQVWRVGIYIIKRSILKSPEIDT